MKNSPVPDELTVRRTIAEHCRELRLLRSIERALARYRHEQSIAESLRRAVGSHRTSDNRQEVPSDGR